MQKETQELILVAAGCGICLGITAFCLFRYYTLKTRKELEQKVEQARVAMQDHTYQAVGQDLHDNVGQVLSLIKLNLNMLSEDDSGNGVVANLKELVGNVTTDLRDLGSGYYSDRIIDKGLIAALRHQARQVEKTQHYKVIFETDTKELPLGKEKIVALYRMVQESLSNIVQHEHADTIRIIINGQGMQKTISVADNGRGFNQRSPGFARGMGLRSMEQRASGIGARMQIQSEPGNGTTVSFIFT